VLYLVTLSSRLRRERAIVKNIVEAAKTGERDLVRLREAGLAAVRDSAVQ
jgi:hypothetical protein